MSEPQQAKKSEQATSQGALSTILINNQERIEIITIPNTNESLVLMPGLNLVEPGALRACRENKMFDSKFSTKIPRHAARECASERVGEPMLVQGKDVPASAPLSKLSDPEAVELIAMVNLEELAERLLIIEGRSEVRAALANRLTLLKTGNPPEASA